MDIRNVPIWSMKNKLFQHGDYVSCFKRPVLNIKYFQPKLLVFQPIFKQVPTVFYTEDFKFCPYAIVVRF